MPTRMSTIVLAGVLGSSVAVARCAPSLASLDPAADPRVLMEHGRQFEAMGEMDSAYAYYGRALAQDTSGAAMLRLLEGSPVVSPRRDLAAEVAFVREVRALVAATPAWSTGARRIETAEQAMGALEGLLAHRQARIEVRHPTRGFPVEYRRWLYRDDPDVLWSSLQSDTTVMVPAAAYQFRYRPAGAARDTVVTLPCANGCRVPAAP